MVWNTYIDYLVYLVCTMYSATGRLFIFHLNINLGLNIIAKGKM